MWNEPLGGKPIINTSEFQKIIPRLKGASKKKTLEYQRQLGLASERYNPTKSDPDIELISCGVFNRIGYSPSFNVEYYPERGRIETIRETSCDFLKEDVKQIYAKFNKNKLTHRGRKAIKNDLILCLLWAISARKYTPEIKMSKILMKDEKTRVIDLFSYLVNLDEKTPLDMRVSYMLMDDHFFDHMDQEKHRQSMSEEICKDPSSLPIVGKVIPLLEQEVLRRVQRDLIRRAPERAKKKKISMDWICLAAYILCVRVFEKRMKIKILKPNTQLCDIWGVSPETLKRRIAYLKQL